MRYLYERGKSDRRVNHIQRFNHAGEPLMEALCGINLRFDTSINVPLGRTTCKNCLKIYKPYRTVSRHRIVAE